MNRVVNTCPKCKSIETLRFHGIEKETMLYECYICGWIGSLEDCFECRIVRRRMEK